MNRGFELVTGYNNKLPSRSTRGSAGYDFVAVETVTIPPFESVIMGTGVKAYMREDEVLHLFMRSGLANKGLKLSTSVSVIDSDYYNNPKNEGHILVKVENNTEYVITIHKGDRFIQGVFIKYLLTDDDEARGDRVGGFGSTGG